MYYSMCKSVMLPKVFAERFMPVTSTFISVKKIVFMEILYQLCYLWDFPLFTCVKYVNMFIAK